jgi:CBS domain-containing protein
VLATTTVDHRSMTVSLQDHTTSPSHTYSDVTVSDVFHPGVVACPPDATMRDVAAALTANNIHCLVVDGIVDGPGGERLVWLVLDDLDVAGILADPAADLDAARAGDVGKAPAVTVAPEDPLPVAAKLMSDNGVTHLIVAGDGAGRPIGVISALDLARAVATGVSGSTAPAV